MTSQRSTIQGSYRPEDVTFLLKRVAIEPTDVETKEKLIQTGAAHYSEMISEERRPDERYLSIFKKARERGDSRIAQEVSALARSIVARIQRGLLADKITLCSLVRAGVPYGVLLQRELSFLGIDSAHYGVSIIRDKGLDENAMAYILARRPLNGVVFVDGWTGKGAIATELNKSWDAITGQTSARLVVLADPGGFAWLAASHDDWLIPSGILGASVSGLISRSILNKQVVGKHDFHGSIPVEHLADIDMSLDFVDRITLLMNACRDALPVAVDAPDTDKLRALAMSSVYSLANRFSVTNLNRIKPGIAEATRAVLRRKPQAAFVRSLADEDLAALIHLCKSDGVPLVEDADITGPFRAITLIEKTS